jgi:uncharacterized protein YndB with AHSA1/START domain
MSDEDIAGRAEANLTLVVRKTIRAGVERLFDAWTEANQLRKWWGPVDVRCIGAEVDLRVGGQYRIGNQLPDGTILWIAGEFEAVEKPHKLVYRWLVEGDSKRPERVTVRFEPRDGATEVIVIHQLIQDESTRGRHEQGWLGCLTGLLRYIEDE